MGTNFYKKRMLTSAEKEELIAAINDDRIESFTYMSEGKYVSSFDLKTPLEVHIGKRSAGWSFLFDHNDWRYFHDKESLEKFLSEGGWIEDEYGDKITCEEFWKMVEEFNKKSVHQRVYKTETRDGLDFDTNFC